MRGVSGYAVGVGIGLVLLGLVNHFALKVLPIAHASTVIFALGALLALAGIALATVGSSKSS
jgi:hypothetical protein